jgi:hypothetical protein
MNAGSCQPEFKLIRFCSLNMWSRLKMILKDFLGQLRAHAPLCRMEILS